MADIVPVFRIIDEPNRILVSNATHERIELNLLPIKELNNIDLYIKDVKEGKIKTHYTMTTIKTVTVNEEWYNTLLASYYNNKTVREMMGELSTGIKACNLRAIKNMG